MTNPTQTNKTFTPTNPIFLPLSPYLPRFMNSQNTPLSPYVNQLANNALINPSKSLNVGIASAITQAIVQRINTMSAQAPKLDQLRLDMRSVPRNRRT